MTQLKMLLLIVLVVGLDFYVNPVFADHPVTGLLNGSGGPIITSSGRTAKKGAGAIGINFQHIDFDNFSNRELIELTDQDEDVHGTGSLQRISIDTVFGFSDRFTAGLSLPFVKRNNLKETAHHDDHEAFERLGDAQGLGDIQVFGQYQIHKDQSRRMFLSTLFGAKLPTGKTDEKSRHGERLEAELQPGSGSIDPFFGFALSQHLGTWDLHTNMLYTLAAEGSQDTDLGDVFNYNIALTASLLELMHQSHEHSAHAHKDNLFDHLNLVLEMNGEWRDRIEIDHEKERNSGGNIIYLSPGVSLATHGWVVSALAGWPIVNNLYGEQSDPEFRFVLKLTKLIGE